MKLGFLLFSITYRVSQQIDVSREIRPQGYTPAEAWDRMTNQHREMWEAEAENQRSAIEECLANVTVEGPAGTATLNVNQPS